MRPFIALSAIAFLSIGCEPVTHYNRIRVASFQPSPKVARGTVKVFQTAEEIGMPFTVVALLTSDGDAADEASILNAMLYRAADAGADGLLLTPPKSSADDPNAGSQKMNVDVRVGWAALVGEGNRRIYRAQAIKLGKN